MHARRADVTSHRLTSHTPGRGHYAAGSVRVEGTCRHARVVNLTSWSVVPVRLRHIDYIHYPEYCLLSQLATPTRTVPRPAGDARIREITNNTNYYPDACDNARTGAASPERSVSTGGGARGREARSQRSERAPETGSGRASRRSRGPCRQQSRRARRTAGPRAEARPPPSPGPAGRGRVVLGAGDA